MSARDPLQKVREALEMPAFGHSSESAWHFRKPLGEVARFRTQRLAVSLVGTSDRPSKILLETIDHKDGPSSNQAARSLHFLPEHAPALLTDLLEAEVLCADLDGADPSRWPEMPIEVSNADHPFGSIRVRINQFKGYLQIQLNKNARTKSDEWAVWGPRENSPMMRLILEAFDVITQVMEDPPDSEPEADGDGIPF